MNTEINHTTADKFIIITKNSLSIDLTNIEDLKTADTFTQELSTYIKTRSVINKSSNDTKSHAIGYGVVGTLGVSTGGTLDDAVTSAGSVTSANAGAVTGLAAGVGFLARFATLFRTKKVPASEIQAEIAKKMLLLGKDIGLDSMSIKITKGSSISIGGDLTGLNAELSKSDDNTIELSVKY